MSSFGCWGLTVDGGSPPVENSPFGPPKLGVNWGHWAEELEVKEKLVEKACAE